MKRVFLAAFILLSLTTMAQTGDRGARGGGQMREMMKERIKTELKLTDTQTDSVVSIQQEFQMKSREVRTNESLGDEDKKSKVKQLEIDRNTKLKTVLNEEQLVKLNEFYENMRKMREQRQGQRQNNK